MDSSDNSAMLMHLLENDGDNPFCAIFLPTMNRSTYHTPMVWQHIQRAAPLHVQPFSQNTVGKVLLTLQYSLIKNRLIVDLIQVKDIVGRQNCDIFLSTQLVQNCKILEKYEISRKCYASNIYFKTTMEFNVPITFFYSNDANLLIKVCQNTKKADEIGHLVIGPQGNSAGVQHWRKIFNTPNTSFSAWHVLTSAISSSNKFFNYNLYSN
ncbi:unnamed protein product [Acanthocheilonema viteae]|uniref:C2 domain-containing protein n=1 Tax=Acanthocheilonema viteae TaxID=6277 RepID=A0A498SEZ4_ACAVI|nr:unnamed protein product [Acanthocheilonema viteae]